jgi:hypothetical protein
LRSLLLGPTQPTQKVLMGGVDAEILPLHGELSQEEQARVFVHYDKPKCIVATNVAQTSITIDDIDAVVDSGLERRIEVVHGVEGLYLRPISLADSEQRRGRAGRTKPGIYLDHAPTFMQEHGIRERVAYPVAEILRSRLDNVVLRLACAGFDAERLTFFHQPSASDIQTAKRALRALALLDGSDQPTPKGRRASSMPVAPSVACMLIEAERLGVVDECITVAALMEIEGITINKDEHGYQGTPWRALCSDETESDVLAQLAVYKAALKFKRLDEFKRHGVIRKKLYQVRDLRRHICDVLRKQVRMTDEQSMGNARRLLILQAVCAGMLDRLYCEDYGHYVNGDSRRQGDKHSVVPSGTKFIVASPKDLEIKTKYGLKTLPLLRMMTKVDPVWLTKLAPHLSEVKHGQSAQYDSQRDSITSTTEVYFAGQKVSSDVVVHPGHENGPDIFVSWLVERSIIVFGVAGEPDCVTHNRQIIQNARMLNRRANRTVFPCAESDWFAAWMRTAAQGATSVAQLDQQRAKLPELAAELLQQLERDYPSRLSVGDLSFDVTYDPQPLIQVRDTSLLWKLPDAVRLPSGVLVEIVTEPDSWYPTRSSNVIALRAKYKARADKSRIDEWVRTAEDIDMPVDAECLPLMETREIGVSVIDGSPIMMYGNVIVEQHYQAIRYRTEWLTDQDEAVATHKRQLQEFENVRQRRLFERARDALRAVWDALSWDDQQELDRGLCDQVQQMLAVHFPSEAWQAEVEGVEELRTALERAIVNLRETQELERQELAVMRLDGLDVREARKVRAFAEALMVELGGRRAIKLVSEQMNAPYGRARRQSAIEEECPSTRVTQPDFFSFGKASVVDAWLDGALSWLEAQSTKVRQPVVHQQEEAVRTPEKRVEQRKPSFTRPPQVDVSALQARFNRKR